MDKKLSIITITTMILVLGGMVVVQAVNNQQAHASIFKDSNGKGKESSEKYSYKDIK